MCVTHHHVEHGGHYGVAARYRHGKAKRIAPRAILLNARYAGERRGRHRGHYLRVAPTENLAGGATQPNNATALKGAEAGAGERDGSSGEARGRAHASELKRVHGKWYRRAEDAVLQDLDVAGSRSSGHQSDHLGIAPALYHAIQGAKPNLAAALGRAEAGARDRHLGSRDATGRRNVRNRRGIYSEW